VSRGGGKKTKGGTGFLLKGMASGGLQDALGSEVGRDYKYFHQKKKDTTLCAATFLSLSDNLLSEERKRG